MNHPGARLGEPKVIVVDLQRGTELMTFARARVEAERDLVEKWVSGTISDIAACSVPFTDHCSMQKHSCGFGTKDKATLLGDWRAAPAKRVH